MSLQRVGFTTFAVGLFVGTVLLVLGPGGSGTLVSCPGPRLLSGFAIEGAQAWPPRVYYTDGCDGRALDPSFAVAFLVALLGLLVAAAGQVADSVGGE
ncbi:hypothetical protein [Halorarum salinum]|uniref:Uncharacterized protein n=1 Tax=Halorarum salinum TaxID=2743089 RepID=A0A7D5LAL4_9EURY|nr:hypothetical protein [Halobaculum salinum]QLG61575.1 hypothetical protein HUG12_07480 [Halobaculum salinum]